jgi:putative nucleotidyltransferase with HDIG domain|tara:strand:- start:160 stop:789 length:630 start_codon:yes stop_codon:yes gene_type:complete
MPSTKDASAAGLPFPPNAASPKLPRMDQDEAFALLKEYTQSESLIGHAQSVEAAMKHYAGRLGGDVNQWGLTGLLHDFDYERWPEEPEHTREGAKILRDRDVGEEVVGAILSHASWNQDEYPLDRPIRRTLFAVDELCGFITAVAYVRPSGLEGMKAKSVRKKLKTKKFAAAVSREDIDQGAELLEMELNEHITEVIAALQKASERASK